MADVNGDGRPDIIVANLISGGSYGVSVLLGKGDGTFRTLETDLTNYDTASVAVADVNGDGKPDIVVTHSGGNTLSVLLGAGNGTFTPISPTDGVGLRNTPYLTDLTGDGTPDSVILDSTGDILFRKGLPGSDSEFAPPVTINASVYNPATTSMEELTAHGLTVLQTPTGSAVATADAIPDPTLLATEHQFVYSVSLYTYGPDDAFERSTAFTTTLLPTSIAAADLTGDGLDDIVVADSLNDSVQVAFQQPDGSFSAPLTLSTGVAPSDIALVDVDGDGGKDIVVTDQASGDVTVLLNEGNGTFAAPMRFQASPGLNEVDNSPGSPVITSLAQSTSLAAGDFLGDGRNDLVVVNRGAHSFTVLQNDGNGGFGNPQAALTTLTSDGFAINDEAGPVVAGDFTGDGKPDLAILMEDRGEVWIYTNEGDGVFTHTSSISAGASPTGLSVVHDPRTGFLDLLVGNAFGDILTLIGDGRGKFIPPPPVTGDSVPLDVLSSPGTKTPVVVVADQAANLVTLQTPVAGGTAFQTVQTLAAAAQIAPGAVQFARLDGTHSPFIDAVVLASGANSVLVYPGIGFNAAGAPIFAAVPQTYFVGTDPVGLTIADVNDDGVLDILTANKGSNDVSVLFGSIDSSGRWVGTLGPV